MVADLHPFIQAVIAALRPVRRLREGRPYPDVGVLPPPAYRDGYVWEPTPEPPCWCGHSDCRLPPPHKNVYRYKIK